MGGFKSLPKYGAYVTKECCVRVMSSLAYWSCYGMTDSQQTSSVNTTALTVHTVAVPAWRFSPPCWKEMCHHLYGNGTAVWHPWIQASCHRLKNAARSLNQVLKATVTLLVFILLSVALLCVLLLTVVNNVMVHEVLHEAHSSYSICSFLVAHKPIYKLLCHKAVRIRAQVVASVLN